MTIQDRAKTFAALHAGPKLLVLPNAWDAGSARIIESAGATAIATSSAAVAWAHGYADGQFLPFETLLATVREIVKTVSIPVSADIEAAYAHDAATAAKTVAAGDRRRRRRHQHRGRQRRARPARQEDRSNPKARPRASRCGYLGQCPRRYLPAQAGAKASAAYDETVRRAKLYREAGANSIFAPGLTDLADLTRLVKDVVLPLNCLAWPGLPDGAALEKIGVRRLSAGSGIGKASCSATRWRWPKRSWRTASPNRSAKGALTNPELSTG